MTFCACSTVAPKSVNVGVKEGLTLVMAYVCKSSKMSYYVDNETLGLVSLDNLALVQSSLSQC